MKKLLLTCALIMSSTVAQADQMFGIDFNQPINKQFAGDPYTTWVEGGIQIAEPQRGIKYITIEVSGFDANGDTYPTGGFMLYSNAMPDEKTCQSVSMKIKKQIIQGTRFVRYYGKDNYGCEKGYDNEWYFVYGGDINPQ